MTTIPGNTRRKGRAQIAAREVPPPIQWHEGMLLAPQHFQQLSLRHELLVHYHAAAASPYHWGVRHLEVDPVALVDGIFRVVDLEAVLPDGLVITHSTGDVPELSVDLTQKLDDMKHRPVTVHLAVVARGRGLAMNERYASEDGGSIADENTGEGELPMPVLKPKVQLLLGDDIPPKYITFPLARIAYRNEAFTRARYEPPWLRVAPGSTIYELCSTLAARLREKATFLAEQVRSPSSSASVPQLVDTKILVHGLVGELPAFEAILRSGVSHPFPLYVTLCSLLGHVAGLGRALVPPVLEPYDHNDVFASFDQVVTAISKSVAEGIHEAYTPYPFVVEGDEFHINFDPNWVGRPMIIGVRAPSGVSDQDMATWVGRSVIASRSKLMPLRDRRVTGAARRQIDADADLVPPRGVTLY
ncbi:MAG TPA: type VI secretion system baseplate subunit TssK, partial [Thermoanaerobaculia bacterium]|nr:type VI secretion system baseplate subunit TssK [Thermoanaerobaculia bacterium]